MNIQGRRHVTIIYPYIPYLLKTTQVSVKYILYIYSLSQKSDCILNLKEMPVAVSVTDD